MQNNQQWNNPNQGWGNMNQQQGNNFPNNQDPNFLAHQFANNQGLGQNNMNQQSGWNNGPNQGNQGNWGPNNNGWGQNNQNSGWWLFLDLNYFVIILKLPYQRNSMKDNCI